ncbi:MAG: response regulator transcription factor [Eubacteriales bacterium]|nr:response regulator transcription factor [Eubacteriales bacterium]
MSENKSPVILLVEDNEHVLKLNEAVLKRKNFHVLTAGTLEDTRKILEEHPAVDIAVLDILLPDGNGLEFIPELRQICAASVLMLTSRRDYEDMVKGLTGGADDYMTKPYRIEELQARIVALLARRHMKVPSRLVCGPIELDLVAYRAYLKGQDMLLNPREYTALLYLIQHEGQGISPKSLYEAVWKLPMHGDARAVRTTVSRLRRKLEGSEYTITSGWGSGYCFGKEE